MLKSRFFRNAAVAVKRFKPMKRHAIVLGLPIALLLCALQAPARETAPSDDVLTIRMGESVFRVPSNYLEYRSASRIPEKSIELSSFAFAFRMPDARPLDIELAAQRTARSGITDQSGDYTVHVRSVQVSKIPMDASSLQNQQTHEKLKREEKYGLIEYEWKMERTLRRMYLSREGAEPRVFMNCQVPSPGITDPSCLARVSYAQEGLRLSINFPIGALPEWKQVIDNSVRLASSWRAH